MISAAAGNTLRAASGAGSQSFASCRPLNQSNDMLPGPPGVPTMMRPTMPDGSCGAQK